MTKVWSDIMWEDYLYWQGEDKKTLVKINKLILDIERNGLRNGIGKPEPLKSKESANSYSKRKNAI